MANDNKKKYVKLEENGQIQLPIDFDDAEIPKEIQKFLETHTPILNFKFPKNNKKTMVISFEKKQSADGEEEQMEPYTGPAYNPDEVPSYIR